MNTDFEGGGKLKEIMYGIFAISIFLFLGGVHYFLGSHRSGAYPPRNILRKRSGAMTIGGIVFLAIGLLLLLILK